VPYSYTLSETIPFLRLALRNLGTQFTLTQFVNALWAELAKIPLPEIVAPKFPQPMLTQFVYSNMHTPLPSVTMEAFSFSIRSGFIMPSTLNFPPGEYFGLHWILTPAGKSWAAGDAAPPEDEAGHLAHIRALVTKPNRVVLEYVGEALRTFNRQAYLAAAVMLGAAFEAAIYDLSDAVVIALVPGKRRNMLEDFDKKRKLHSMLALIAQVLQHGSVQAEFKSAQLHLASLFDSIRIQRNEAVHPETGTVSMESLRAAFDAFPRAYQVADRLTDWLKNCPSSLT
jgi:hypothetical protein